MAITAANDWEKFATSIQVLSTNRSSLNEVEISFRSDSAQNLILFEHPQDWATSKYLLFRSITKLKVKNNIESLQAVKGQSIQLYAVNRSRNYSDEFQ